MIPRRLLGSPLLLIAVLGLVWLASARLHWNALCLSGEWPQPASCDSPSTPPSERINEARSRVQTSPGDSEAWLRYLLQLNPVEGSEAPGAPNPYRQALSVSTRLRPNDIRVQRLAAVEAIRMQNWPVATAWLLQLVEYAQDRPAASALAQLLTQPEVQSTLMERARQGTAWLDLLIQTMKSQQIDLLHASPVVWAALQAGQLSPAQQIRIVQMLRQQGQWEEAYALWVRMQKQEVEILHNRHFEGQSQDDGFGWTFPEQAPTKVSMRYAVMPNASGQHHLELSFTGRPLPSTLLSQDLLIEPGGYRLSGRWLARDLRSQQGLHWSMRCLRAEKSIGNSPALDPRQADWGAIDWVFDVPADCGPAVRLSLHASSTYENLRGLRGQVWLDDLDISPLPR